MKTLVIFYSYGHHTKDVGMMMAEKLACDIAELQPEKPYTAIYQDLVDETENNKEDKNTPKIKVLDKNLEDYEQIIIGTPVWWYTMAEPIRTFLKENDLKKKKVALYATNARWLGSTFQDMIELIGNQKIATLDVKYSVDGENRLTQEQAIDEFLEHAF